MDLQPQIVEAEERKLIGLYVEMSLTSNLTGQVWGQFGPKIKEIGKRICTDRISLQIYHEDYFKAFDPSKEFVKWAAVEVEEFENIPNGLETLIVPSGLYAKFDYIGAGNDPAIFQYIYNQWIPNSKFELDNRPHFEVLGDNYKNNDPDSEEEIWIPVRIADS
jgi:AraC family transcriptional regulator